jgi:hypothetical protein
MAATRNQDPSSGAHKAVVEQENGELTESTLQHERVDAGRRKAEHDRGDIRPVHQVAPLDEDEEMQLPPS